MPRSETLFSTAAKGSAVAALVGGLFGLVLRPDASNGVYQLGSRTVFAVPHRLDEASAGLHQPGNLMVLVANPAKPAAPAPKPAPARPRLMTVAPPDDQAQTEADQDAGEPVHAEGDASAQFTETAWRAAEPRTLNDQIEPPATTGEAEEAE